MNTLKCAIISAFVCVTLFVIFNYYTGKLYQVGPEVEMCARIAASQENTEALIYSGYVNEYGSFSPPKIKEVFGQAIFKDKRVVDFNCRYRVGDMNISAIVKDTGFLPN